MGLQRIKFSKYIEKRANMFPKLNQDPTTLIRQPSSASAGKRAVEDPGSIREERVLELGPD
jgi:hypothetical protein